MKIRTAVRLGLLLLALSTLALAQSANQAIQNPPIKLGTSGGNVNDISARYCCSGTLGALVQKGKGFYVLSNNHILARSDQAQNDENISQPGLVDNGCLTAGLNYVAQFSSAPKLGTANVDAAIAAVTGNMVDTSGAILDIGVPSATPAAIDATAIGRGVAKSGRTTGLTCSSIKSITTDVRVQYETQCGMGSTWIVSYTDQVLIGGRFSAGGDSGSLIVTSDTAQPIGLLFAGSSNTTIANPVSDVISALGVSFVGGSGQAVAGCQKSGGKPRNPHAAPRGLDRALVAKARNAGRLMSDPAIQGVGVGVADDNPDEAVVVIYVEAGRVHGPVPNQIDGVRTEVIRTDRFRAWGWNEPAGAFCRASR